jgi:hypothetical protein
VEIIANQGDVPSACDGLVVLCRRLGNNQYSYVVPDMLNDAPRHFSENDEVAQTLKRLQQDKKLSFAVSLLAARAASSNSACVGV